MKTIVKFMMIGAAGLLLSSAGCSLDNVTPDSNVSSDGGGTITTPTTNTVVKNIIANVVTITVKKDVPSLFEFTNNAGTDVILTSATVNAGTLAIVNAIGANATLTNVTATGATINYSNIILSPNDLMSSDAIASYASTNVYIVVPVDKTTYGYDELHIYLSNDGNAGAGQINITGATTQVTTADVPLIFSTSKAIVTKSVIK